MNEKLNFELLYDFEFRIIPRFIFFKRHNLLNYANDSEWLFNKYKEFCNHRKVDNNYCLEDFSSRIILNDNAIIYELCFPKPFMEPLCEKAYIFIIKNFFTKVRYYTLERGNREGKLFLCECKITGHRTFGEKEFLRTLYYFEEPYEVNFFKGACGWLL